MKDLLLSELRRFRTLGVSLAAAHLLVLIFFNRQTDLLQLTYFDGLPLLAYCMAVGLALAAAQVGSYRKPSQWLWLMHRPLSSGRIFAALALAALALLALTLLLPMLLLVLGTDLFTHQVVDSRHYLAPVHLLAFATMAWLAGAHACLSRHKLAITVLAAPVLLSLHLISVYWLLLPVALGLAWLAWIAFKSFRADREAPIEGPVNLLLTALPLQLGVFLLLFSLGQFLFVTVGMLVGTDPLNTNYPPKGGLIETLRAEPGDEMILGLANSRDPRAANWREQLPLLEPVRVGPWLNRYALRDQWAGLNVPTQWEDEKRRILWTFSHDRMLFHGRDPRSGADKGWWGLEGAGNTTRFAEVPFVVEGYLMTRRGLYAIDAEAQRLHTLLVLPAGESFTDIPNRALNRLLLLTNRRLLAYRTDRQAVSAYAPPLLDWQYALPRGPQNLEGLSIAALMDGWLVSAIYDEGHRQVGFIQLNLAVEPWQQLAFIDNEGRATAVGERRIRRDYPPMQQVAWWLSPPLHVLAEWPERSLDKGLSWPLQTTVLPDRGEFYLVAGALMLASLGLAFAWLRGSAMPPARRRFWLASCAALGLPAFISLICLEPRAARH